MEGDLISAVPHATYRLKLAQGFLEEARQDKDLGRWRSTVDSAQLAVENAGKAILALAGRIGRTHNPSTQIRRLVDERRFEATSLKRLERLAELGEYLGPDIHVQTDYGDEVGGRTPWELFDEADARQAFAIAEEAVDLAGQLIQELGHER